MGTIREGKPNSLAAASEDYQLFIKAQIWKILMSISNTNTNTNEIIKTKITGTIAGPAAKDYHQMLECRKYEMSNTNMNNY